MKRLCLSLLFVIGLTGIGQAQLPSPLGVGSLVTNFPVPAATNVVTIAGTRDNLVNRQIVNTNAASDLIVFAIKPVASVTSFIVSNQYFSGVTGSTTNYTTMGLQTNIPPNVVVTTVPLNYKLFVVAASSSTNINWGNELYGTYTNGTVNTTNTVWITDVFLQR